MDVSTPAVSEIVIHVSGLSPGGVLQLAIFDGPESWKRRGPAAFTRSEAVRRETTELKVDGLPPGRYGIMAFHDRNSDKRLNTLPIGLPTEPYGFSNNARGAFGPPNWAAASFEVRGTVRQSIRLK